MGGQQSEPVVWVSASLTDKKNLPTLQNNLMLGSLKTLNWGLQIDG